jgi:hypothetical protein
MLALDTLNASEIIASRKIKHIAQYIKYILNKYTLLEFIFVNVNSEKLVHRTNEPKIIGQTKKAFTFQKAYLGFKIKSFTQSIHRNIPMQNPVIFKNDGDKIS